jgi:hypothetical protein
VLTVCVGQALLAFARNLTVIGLPSAALLFPEYLFAASLDVRCVARRGLARKTASG